MTTPAAPNDAGLRTLRLVNAAADIWPGDRTPTVILDTAWTPPPGTPGHIIPLRPALLEALDAANVFEASLAAIDAWADASDLVDTFTNDSVTWWYHARSFVRLELQELMTWGRVLELLAPGGRYARFLVPDDRPLLARAVCARTGITEADLVVERGSAFRSSDLRGKPVMLRAERSAREPEPALSDRMPGISAPEPETFPAGPSSVGVELLGPIAAPIEPIAAAVAVQPARPKQAGGRRVTARILASLRTGVRHVLRRPRGASDVPPSVRRLRRLAAVPGSVLSVVRVDSFHTTQSPDGPVRQDPYVGPVAQRLGERGLTVVTVAIGLQRSRKAHRRMLRRDPGLVSWSVGRELPGAPGPEDVAALEAESRDRLTAIPHVSLPDGNRDLGPVLRDIVASLAPWLAAQWADAARAGLVLDTLRPAALVTGWEAARTAWLAAAKRRRIPTVAIQHGVVYPLNPDYHRPAHPAIAKPTLTCTYGEWDRRILLDEGAYAPDSVVATGSPRVGDPYATEPLDPETREAVRAELGVQSGYRMLVVSGGRMTVGDRLFTLPVVARVLDGELPGIHIVFKLHPEERDEGQYRELLEGLAAAGRYPAPPVTVISQIDIYRLLQAADAHLGVVSTVLTDAVVAGVPNMIVVGQALADLLGYVGAGVAAPVRTVDDVRKFLAEPAAPDATARRRFIDDHFAAGDAASRIADLVAAQLPGRADLDAS